MRDVEGGFVKEFIEFVKDSRQGLGRTINSILLMGSGNTLAGVCVRQTQLALDRLLASNGLPPDLSMLAEATQFTC